MTRNKTKREDPKASCVTYYQVNKDHAYWTEKRRGGVQKGGHTAGLLTYFRGDSPIMNVLFDAGMGTIEGLADLAEFSWEVPLCVFITHGHIDHHADLMILSELWCKRMGRRKPGPLLVYCTGSSRRNTWQSLRETHGYGFGNGRTLKHVAIRAGQPMSISAPKRQLGVPLFEVTGLDNDHFPGAVIYVVTFGQERWHKIIIGWDMKTLPDPDKCELLKAPSLALLEANTWTSCSKRTGHTSVADIRNASLVRKLGIAIDREDHYGVYLVHYGGLEDPSGILSEGMLELKCRQVPEFAGLVRVAARGQRWTFRL